MQINSVAFLKFVFCFMKKFYIRNRNLIKVSCHRGLRGRGIEVGFPTLFLMNQVSLAVLPNS